MIYCDQNYELQNLKIAWICNISDQAIMNKHSGMVSKLEILVLGCWDFITLAHSRQLYATPTLTR